MQCTGSAAWTFSVLEGRPGKAATCDERAVGRARLSMCGAAGLRTTPRRNGVSFHSFHALAVRYQTPSRTALLQQAVRGQPLPGRERCIRATAPRLPLSSRTTPPPPRRPNPAWVTSITKLRQESATRGEKISVTVSRDCLLNADRENHFNSRKRRRLKPELFGISVDRLPIINVS